LHEGQRRRGQNWPRVSKTALWEAYDATHNLRYPSFTIHRSNLSRILSSFGRSPLISPDISILVKGGHRDLSDTFTDPILLLSNAILSDISQTRDLKSTLQAYSALFSETPPVVKPFLPIIFAK